MTGCYEQVLEQQIQTFSGSICHHQYDIDVLANWLMNDLFISVLVLNKGVTYSIARHQPEYTILTTSPHSSRKEKV